MKSILRYGLIGGFVLSIILVAVTFYIQSKGRGYDGFDNSIWISYAGMALSMSAIYFGIKNYRDEHKLGVLHLGEGLLVGFGILLICCVLYSLTWLVMYYNFMPNFIEDYAASEMTKLQKAGASVQELADKKAEMDGYKEMYSSPLGVFGLSLLEPSPVGLLYVIISAFILRKKA